MNSPLDVVDLLVELLTWIGLLLGGACLLTLLILRGARGGWVETEAVVVDDGDGALVRWMTVEGELHSGIFEADDAGDTFDPDQLRIFYSRRAPHRYRLHAAAHGERVLQLLAFVLLGIGGVSFIVSIVLLFIPH